MGEARLREVKGEGLWAGADCLARTSKGGTPPAPPWQGGRGLWAGLRSLAGENNVLRLPPVAPLRKGGEGCALAGAY